MSPARLRIGLVAPPWVTVPPQGYGGTELVVDQLARGLARAGHDVRLFATGDSTCPVELHWVHATAVGTTGPLTAEVEHVRAAYRALADCDLIHDHTLLGPLWATTDRGGPPVITTAHGEFTSEMSHHYMRVGESAAVVAISQHQRRTAPSVPVAAVIHHGIDVETVPVGRGGGGYVAFVGRMDPGKGVHRAIDIARAAGKKLLIAAKMWEPAERRYYADHVAPRLGPDATYLGHIDRRETYHLLGSAEAVLNPIRRDEPFGLVMIEALATGTPVLTFAEGAAPEIVEDGVTGFLCYDEADMVARLRSVGTIDRRRCRHRAETHFSTERMVRNHLELYHQVLQLVGARGALRTPASRHGVARRGPRPLAEPA